VASVDATRHLSANFRMRATHIAAWVRPISLVALSLALAAGASQCRGAEVSSAETIEGAPILLYAGTGTSPNDVAALASILRDNRLEFARVTASQMNTSSADQLSAHRVLIVPGGNFIEIGRGLSPGAAAAIRAAVQNGLSYLGICAGGFLAGDAPDNGLNLTGGVRFGFYGIEGRGVHKAAVAVTAADGSTLDQYWEDGPQFTGWGTMVGRYPDGTAAVVQAPVGQGWVILAGTHPEAPESWQRGMSFATPARANHAYALALIRAALERNPLPHF
jgi:hypothetical protein